MFKIKKQIYSLLTISALSSFQIAGASWVALLFVRGYSLVEIGFAESCFHLASFLFEVPSGVIADVFGRKRSMILSQCMFILSAVGMISSKSMAGICVSLVFEAMGYNFASGTREALAFDSLKAAKCEERYLEFSSLEMTIYRIGNASAVLCAGAALLIGYRRAYMLDVISGIVCLFISFQLKEIGTAEEKMENKISERIIQCFRESISFLIHNLASLRLMFMNAFVGAISILTIFYLQAKLEQSILPDIWLGPMLFFVSLGGAVGAKLTVASVKLGYRTVYILCFTGVLIGMFCGGSSYVLVMCIGGFFSGLCNDLLEVRTDAVLNERFPSSQRATLISVSSLCFSCVMIVLSPIMGYVFS